MALNPDGSAVNPQALLNAINNPMQLANMPPELADVVRSGDVNKFQVWGGRGRGAGLFLAAVPQCAVKQQRACFFEMVPGSVQHSGSAAAQQLVCGPCQKLSWHTYKM